MGRHLMGALLDLAARAERAAATLRPRALEVAADAVRAAILDGLAPHRRTGTAASTLRVEVATSGISIDGADYIPTLRDVPRMAELERIAADAYNAAVRAELGA
jgi:hypothetical protein